MKQERDKDIISQLRQRIRELERENKKLCWKVEHPWSLGKDKR